MTTKELILADYKAADDQTKEFMIRLVNVFAHGSEAGKKILWEADIAHMTYQQFWDTLKAAENA